MRYEITFTGDAAETLARLGESLVGDRTGLHSALAEGVKVGIRDHWETAGYLNRKNALGGKSTGFWKKVSESVKTSATTDEAVVSITERGFALQYFGGVVKPVTRKALSVPAHKSAHGLNASEYPDKLAFIPASTQFGPFRKGGGQDTVGYLVRGVDRTVTRGPNKGKTRVVPIERPAGELIYVLRRQTYHEPDKGALPTDDAIIAAANAAGVDYLDAVADSQ
jgi:hypothetical protein